MNNGWYQQDLHHVSWNLNAAIPLPEIYRQDGTNAKQWQQLTLYTTVKHNNLMLFKGSMTQYQACIDQNDPCTGLKNTRTQGYQQLWDRMNSDSRTAQTPDSATDLTWQN